MKTRITLAALATIICTSAPAQNRFDRPMMPPEARHPDGRYDRGDRDGRHDDRRNDRRDRWRRDRPAERRVRPGDTVWLDNGLRGTVSGIFPDGRLAVTINGSNSIVDAVRVAVAGCNEFACSRDEAWATNGLAGTINGFFVDGAYSLLIHGSNYKYTRENVAVRGCNSYLCSEDRVALLNGLEGVVNGVFLHANPATMVSVKVSGSNYAYANSNLAYIDPTPLPDDRYRRDPLRTPLSGEETWLRNGLQGRVNGMFLDGRVSVKINGSNYAYDRVNVAMSGCSRRLCSGDGVVATNGLSGLVNGFFNNGQVSVKINGSNYAYAYDQLARR